MFNLPIKRKSFINKEGIKQFDSFLDKDWVSNLMISWDKLLFTVLENIENQSANKTLFVIDNTWEVLRTEVLDFPESIVNIEITWNLILRNYPDGEEKSMIEDIYGNILYRSSVEIRDICTNINNSIIIINEVDWVVNQIRWVQGIKILKDEVHFIKLFPEIIKKWAILSILTEIFIICQEIRIFYLNMI
jgi:hypothetical protein